MADLPDSVWMHIFTTMWEQARTDWWNSLDGVEQEYHEWGVDPAEMAETTFESVFERYPEAMPEAPEP